MNKSRSEHYLSNGKDLSFRIFIFNIHNVIFDFEYYYLSFSYQVFFSNAYNQYLIVNNNC